jgi:uncharacterized protein YfiM (DUF2279 family)
MNLAMSLHAQHDTSTVEKINGKRLELVVAGNVAFFAGSFVVLNRAWYDDYEKTSFHFFNDNPEWNQLDKAGHVWSTYHVSRMSARLWQWTGMRRNHAAVAGSVSGMAYQAIIELQDAYSAAWGFSWGDVAANVAGAGLFLAQETGWADQRLQIKMGYHPYTYIPSLRHRRNELFGSSAAERLLKDYNSQTYWLTANLASFYPESRIPKWLNIAVGYGADGMYGGRTNRWVDDEGQVFDYTHIPRSRQVYFSADVDLTRIRVRSKGLRTFLSVINSFRIPLPAIELTKGKVRGVIR